MGSFAYNEQCDAAQLRRSRRDHGVSDIQQATFCLHDLSQFSEPQIQSCLCTEHIRESRSLVRVEIKLSQEELPHFLDLSQRCTLRPHWTDDYQSDRFSPSWNETYIWSNGTAGNKKLDRHSGQCQRSSEGDI